MRQMCPILVSTSVFGEVALQMTLPDEVTRRFDLKVASNFKTAETVFHSKLSLWPKSNNKKMVHHFQLHLIQVQF